MTEHKPWQRRAQRLLDRARTVPTRSLRPDDVRDLCDLAQIVVDSNSDLLRLIAAIQRWQDPMRDDHTLCKAAVAALPTLWALAGLQKENETL